MISPQKENDTPTRIRMLNERFCSLTEQQRSKKLMDFRLSFTFRLVLRGSLPFQLNRELFEMLTIFLIFFIIANPSMASKPHVIFLVADDLGWNDVGFHGSNQIPTPNIDALAYAGVILNNYYVTPICTPSRSALMTGKYPIHTGLQEGVILGSTPYGLSLDEKILPQYMKDNGYTTRAIGKWHLGHFKKEYTPEFRGFDSHYGYWLGRQDYYDHSSLEKNEYWGYDMKRGLNTTWSEYGLYSTDLFTREAVKIIEEHNSSQSLFLYVAYQAVHSGNSYNSLEAPPEAIAKFAYIQDESRRKFAGMLTKLDDSVGEIVAALAKTGMINNSIIVFTTDNGGPAAGFDSNAASNWPLRGVKSTLWEGGVKGVGLIWSPLLPSSIIFNGLVHITDWLPTLLNGIQGNGDSATHTDGLDGINVWKSIVEKTESPRTDILLNIDPRQNISGLIFHSWKFVKGHKKNGEWNGWYGPSGRDGHYDWESLWTCKVAESLQYVTPLPSKDIIERMRSRIAINCNNTNGIQNEDADEEEVFLFDLYRDPCETYNIAFKEPLALQFMEILLSMYRETMVPPRNQPSDPRSHPKYWGYQWINWMDYVTSV